MLLCTERSTFRLLYNTFLAMSNLIKLHVPFRLKWVWHPCAGLKAKLKNMISSLRNHHFCKLLDLKKRECNWLYLYLTLSVPLYYNTVLGVFWNLRAFRWFWLLPYFIVCPRSTLFFRLFALCSCYDGLWGLGARSQQITVLLTFVQGSLPWQGQMW